VVYYTDLVKPLLFCAVSIQVQGKWFNLVFEVQVIPLFIKFGFWFI